MGEGWQHFFVKEMWLLHSTGIVPSFYIGVCVMLFCDGGRETWDECVGGSGRF